MGKHQKLTASARKSPVEAAAPGQSGSVMAEHDVDGALSGVLAHLQRLMGLVDDEINGGEVNPALLRESAGIARSIVQVSGEQLRRQKAFAGTARKLSAALVMAYLRGLGEAERDALLQELAVFEGGGSVLS